MPTCEFCGTPIRNPNTSYRKVTGWERKRTDGGTNALRCREPHDEWACTVCVDKEAKGIGVGQIGMGFGDAWTGR